jgi:S1-C subfamily serine protease
VTATAYATIIPSVVRVDGYDPADATPPDGDPDHVLPPGHPPVPSSHGPASPGTAPDPGKEAATIPNPNGQAPGAQAPNVQAPNGQDPKGQDGGETGKSVYENTAVGSGVVINKDGTILTNLHVAAAASRLRVTFADGTEANASIVGSEPDNDLAIIKPDKVPDDLKPATLASTDGLNPGDEVEAVGFPFGIGPSASAGVVSGLKREFKEEGRGTLRNLIQFDAAANPGNSGGPLVDRDGEVVGIVTGILNPSGVRTFAGIGFAVPIENATSGMGESPL